MLGCVSIRTKLILGFVLGIIFSGINALIAVDKLGIVGHLTTDLYDKPLQSVDFGRSAQIDFRDMVSAWLLAAHVEPARIESIKAEYHRARHVLADDLKVLKNRATSPSVAERTTRIFGLLEQWDAVTHPEPLSSLDEGVIETLAQSIQLEIDRTVEDAKADGFIFVEKARHVAANAQLTTLIISILIFFGGVLVSVILVADIIRPLQTAVAVSEAIAGGNLDQPIMVVRTDEAGKLLRAMDRMRMRLRDRLEADHRRAEEELQLEREHAAVLSNLAQVAAQSRENAEQALIDLRAAQAQLVESEKMASLGGLVAGVAHEINTPLGNALGASTHLRQRTREVRSMFGHGKLKKSDAEAYLVTADEATAIINTNLERASELVQSFKQVAVDQTNDLCRNFHLATYIDDILISLKPRLKKAAHHIHVQCPENLEMEQYAGSLAQVLSNLIMNALIHAFDHREGGTITITAVDQPGGAVELTVADDGCGIPSDTLGHIFEPFFTTKRGDGGSGLGLHIVFNIVTQRLGGSISVESLVGIGTRFTIICPRVIEAVAKSQGEREAVAPS